MLLRITALAVSATAAAPSPALRVAALAAVTTAAAPPFITSKELRPAARRVQDFAECPVLTKIKKDDCGDVKDFEALPFCSDACLCKLRGNQIYGAFVLNHPVVLHAIDATPARWRGDAGSPPLDRARTAASSPRNDLVKNCARHTG